MKGSALCLAVCALMASASASGAEIKGKVNVTVEKRAADAPAYSRGVMEPPARSDMETPDVKPTSNIVVWARPVLGVLTPLGVWNGLN